MGDSNPVRIQCHTYELAAELRDGPRAARRRANQERHRLEKATLALAKEVVAARQKEPGVTIPFGRPFFEMHPAPGEVENNPHNYPKDLYSLQDPNEKPILEGRARKLCGAMPSICEIPETANQGGAQTPTPQAQQWIRWTLLDGRQDVKDHAPLSSLALFIANSLPNRNILVSGRLQQSILLLSRSNRLTDEEWVQWARAWGNRQTDVEGFFNVSQSMLLKAGVAFYSFHGADPHYLNVGEKFAEPKATICMAKK
ncbi:MAG: hypothetical protein HYU97_03885 [Deltaproteobacteria bacterium]|nr:hypothetical protein [Deltaproteobacteria bacterium]